MPAHIVRPRDLAPALEKARPLAQNDYKTHLLRGLLEEELAALAKP